MGVRWHSGHMEREQARAGGGQLAAMVVCAVAAVPFALGLVSVVSSLVGGDNGDPHGYALIFGTLLCVVAGVVLLLVLPSALPRRWRGVKDYSLRIDQASSAASADDHTS